MRIGFAGSLRGKLAVGYVTLSVLALAAIGVNLHVFMSADDLLRDEGTVFSVVDGALEMKRYEKNFFLYGNDEDLGMLRHYAEATAGRMDRGREVLYAFVHRDSVEAMRGLAAEYQRLLVRARPGTADSIWQHELREAGTALLARAERLYRLERESVRRVLRRGRLVVVTTILVFLAIALAMGYLLFHTTVKPLRELQKGAAAIDAGTLSSLSISSADREFVSLTAAINTMLAELKKRQEQLLQSEKLSSLGTLLFSVAHELNNPLASISSSSELLVEELEGGDAVFRRTLLAQIDEGVERARSIVASLLSLSGSGEFSACGVASLVDDAVRLARLSAGGVEIRTEVPEGLRVRGRRQRLLQVLLNLLGNAVNAVEGGGIVTVRGWQSAPGRVSIVVEDTGCGFAAGAAERLFEPFYTTRSEKGGHGLGLFAVYTIVSEHEGTVRAEGEPGRGARFTVELPEPAGEADGQSADS